MPVRKLSHNLFVLWPITWYVAAKEDVMVQNLRVQLFGRPEIVRADGTLITIDSRKALALLAYLIRQRRRLARGTLAALLWGDLPETRGRRNLSRELTQLTALFPDSIVTDHASVGWSDATVWVDTVAVEGLLRVQPPAMAVLDEAVALYRGPFLEGFALDNCAEFESWLLQERELWQQRITGALRSLITSSVEQGDSELALRHSRRWLELEPWQEDAHHTLIVLLARGGQRSAALAQFELCRRVLARELDMEPSQQLLALAEQIRAGELEPLRPTRAQQVGSPLAAMPLHVATEAEPSATAPPQAHDWSPIPSPGRFLGRGLELTTLHHLVEVQRCRVVAVLGMGGIGKTTLTARATRQLARDFDVVVWRSLVNAPPLSELLRACLQALAVPPAAIPELLDDQLALLLDYLRRRRCLLVLDNLESLLQGGAFAGHYRAGVEAYGQLLHLAGSYEHQSCLLLTSRESPQPLAQLAAATPLVQALRIGGLDDEAATDLLAACGLTATTNAPALVARYSGNPLALALVAELIHELYGGDLDAFLTTEAVLFEDIRAVLDQQWVRLSSLEQDLLLWLAVCRRPQGVSALRGLLAQLATGEAVLDALRSLQRRSLVEPINTQFGLQNVVLEYVTARLIDVVCEEIAQGSWRRFNSHALMQTQTLEYVRESQVRLLLAPVAQRLAAHYSEAGLRSTLLGGLPALRTGHTLAPGYAAGNVLNVLLHLGVDLRGADFSRLSVWQADLRQARLPEVSFAHADLRGSLFAETLRDAFAVAWSPDGALISACVGSGELRLWRTSDWQLMGCCTGPSTFIWHLAFSPAGDRLASCGDDGVVRVWDVATCQPLSTLRGHQDLVQTLDWSPDGCRLISGSRDRTARIWDVERATTVHELHGHTERVRWVAWSPDGHLVATASLDSTVRVWDAPMGKHQATFSHPAPVHALVWHPSGRQLATSCEDHQKRVWELDSSTVSCILEYTRGLTYQLAYSPDGTRIAGNGLAALHIWRSGSGQLATTLLGHRQSLAGVAWSPDGALLASRSETSIRVWEVASEQTVALLQGSSSFVHQLAVSPDERLLATSHMDELIRIWDRVSGVVVQTLGGHSNAILGLSFSQDGRTLASAGYDGTVRIWDTVRGTLLRQMRMAQTSVVSSCRSADDTLIATGCHDGTVWVWDWQRGQAWTVLRDHKLPVTAVAFSPDGAHLVSSSEDRRLCRWDLAHEAIVTELRVESGCVYALVVEPAGETLYGGTNNGLLHRWDLATGQLIWFQRAPGAIMRLDRSPDGTRLVSRGEGIVCVWEASSGELLLTHRLERSFGPVRFVNNGGAFLTSGEDGVLRFWDTETGALLRALPTPGLYTGMDVTGTIGLTAAQREGLLSLGAVEHAGEGVEVDERST